MGIMAIKFISRFTHMSNHEDVEMAVIVEEKIIKMNKMILGDIWWLGIANFSYSISS